MTSPKLMVMAGGTGGHVFPALAVAKELQNQKIDVVWLGTKKGLEARVVPENNISIQKKSFIKLSLGSYYSYFNSKAWTG